MGYTCDTCNKTYKHKRNLNRHISEKHTDLEHWNCNFNSCKGRFIRRSYLFTHLSKIHGYSKAEARERALGATRGNQNENEALQDVRMRVFLNF